MLTQRITVGFGYIKRSLIILLSHPYLILYIAVGLVLYYAIGSLIEVASGAPFAGFAREFIRIFIMTFFTFHLVNHTMYLLTNLKTPVLDELKTTVHMPLVAAWACISSVIMIVCDVTMIGVIPMVIWLFFTQFVLPIIATKRMDIWQTLSLSAHLAKKGWMELLSGCLLIFIFIIMPPALIPVKNIASLILIHFPLMVLGYTIQGIFSAVAYDRLSKQ